MATIEEKLEAVKPMDFGKIQSIEDLREVWRKAYSVVGHKVLGRMLLGQTAEEALRFNGK